MATNIWNTLWLISWNILLTRADDRLDPFCVVNGRGVLNRVSEKFLSLSVDPGVLLAGMNLSDSSLTLARHLAPSYIRLAGPTTDLVRYDDLNLPAGRDHIQVSPSMWFGINEWLVLTELSPVFGIGRGPEGVDSLLEISDKLNVSCYWQLGYDNVGRTALQYENDLARFHRMVEAHPDRKDWRIIGSDISPFQDINLDYLKGIVEAFMWEPSNPESREPHKSGAKLWTSLPKSSGPVTFSTALSFAKKVGRVAKMGYEVVFAQPRMYELFSDTPVYWFSFFHKKLMGVNVLEAKFIRNTPKVEVFAHCSKMRKISSKNGILTVMIINENEYEYGTRIVTNLRVSEKNVKVQEYILTSNSLNSTDVFLNGQLLSPESFDSKISSKLSLTKPTMPIPVSLPPHSIGFFVISGARVNVRFNEIPGFHKSMEGDMLFKNIGVNIDSRSIFGKSNVLDDIAERLRKEMSIDEEYYGDPTVNSRIKVKPAGKNGENAINAFNDKAKLQRRRVEYQKRRNELKGKLAPRYLDLQAEGKPETDKVLIRKPRHINLNMLEARFGPLNQTRTPRGINRRLLDSRSKLEESRLRSINKFRDRFKSRRSKRDINLDLLKVKSEKKPPRKYKYQDKEATIRKPGQTSDELLAELEKEMESLEDPTPPIKTEVLAELATSDEDSDESFPRKPKYSNRKRNDRKRKKKEEEEQGEELQFLTSSQEFSDIEEGLPCIHEYFGDTLHIDRDSRKGKHFLKEFAEFMSEEKEEEPKKKKKDSKQPKLDLSEEDMDKYFRRKRSAEDFSLGDLLYPKNPVEYTIDDDLSVEPLTGLKGREILEQEHIALENLKNVGEEGIKLSQPILEDLTDSWLPHVKVDLPNSQMGPKDVVTEVSEVESISTVKPSVLLTEGENTTTGYEVTEQNLEKDKGKDIPKIGSRSLFDLVANNGKGSSEIGSRHSISLETATESNADKEVTEEAPKIGLRSLTDSEATTEAREGTNVTEATKVTEHNSGEDSESTIIGLRGSMDLEAETEANEDTNVGKNVAGTSREAPKLGLRSSIDAEIETEANEDTKVGKNVAAKGREPPKLGLRSSIDAETETEDTKATEQHPVESKEAQTLDSRSSTDTETEIEANEDTKVTDENPEKHEGKEAPKLGLRSSTDTETETEANEDTKVTEENPEKHEGNEAPKLGLRSSADTETETEANEDTKGTEENPGEEKDRETPKIGLRSLSDPETLTEANKSTEDPEKILGEDKTEESSKINLRTLSDLETTTEVTEPNVEEIPKVDVRGFFDQEIETEAENVSDDSSEKDPRTEFTTATSEITTNGRRNEKTTSVAPILRLRLLGSDESHEHDPRHKRDKLQTTEKNSGGTRHNEIKDRLRELKDKLRIDPDRKRNRLKILQSKHNQDLPSDVQTRTQPEEKDTVNDFFGQLQLIRERLQKRKNEIDSMLAANTKRDAEVLSKLSKDLLRTRRSVHLQPLSLTFKPKSWHPADVLSLKRDAFLGSGVPQRSPPNDYYAFRSLRDRYGLRRSKRSEEASGNELDARFPVKHDEQNVIMKGVPNGNVRDVHGKNGEVLGNLNGFLGSVTGFFRDLSRELRDYAKQLGILD